MPEFTTRVTTEYTHRNHVDIAIDFIPGNLFIYFFQTDSIIEVLYSICFVVGPTPLQIPHLKIGY